MFQAKLDDFYGITDEIKVIPLEIGSVVKSEKQENKPSVALYSTPEMITNHANKYSWLTLEDEQQLKQAAATGRSIEEIAQFFKFDRRTVERHLRGEIISKRKVTKILFLRMREEKQQGLRIIDIAKLHNLDSRTVSIYTGDLQPNSSGEDKLKTTLAAMKFRNFEGAKIIDLGQQLASRAFVPPGKVTKRFILSRDENSRISNKKILKIRDQVRNGKTKIQVAIELGISIYYVRKYTKDIHTILTISPDLIKKIRDEVISGKSTRLVAETLNVSRDTVIKYTRDIKKSKDPCFSKRKRLSPEELQKIRNEVQKTKSKLTAAKNLGLSYYLIKWHTQDIKTDKRKFISDEIIHEIRKRYRQGQTKLQISKDMKIEYSIVIKYTKGLPPRNNNFEKHCFEILRKVVKDGYYLCSKNESKIYNVLKEDFPNIIRVRVHGKTILFLEDKGDVAMRAYLNTLDRKITSYPELKQILDIFKAKMDQDEKKSHIQKKRSISSKNFNIQRLRENVDSFVKHYFSNYSFLSSFFRHSISLTGFRENTSLIPADERESHPK
jgi:DNA-binding CsgD family transcriptional regulator